MDSAAMKELEDVARAFTTDSHRQYLAEAGQRIHGTGDPVAALALLHAMWGTSYAKRPQQRTALNDVGEWLEERLMREPGVDAQRLAAELGWLRRLSRITGSAPGDEGRREQGKQELRFGRSIDRIRQRRAAALAPPEVRASAAPRPAAVPMQATVAQREVAPERLPATLPATFHCVFADFFAARQAWRSLKERVKKNKPPKDAVLPLLPADPLLRSLVTGLVCSTQGTQGIEELFKAIESSGGGQVRFLVGEVADRGGVPHAGRILLG